jgi:four helix bundle protein
MVEGLQGLRIFHLAETLADDIWSEVLAWKPFARQTVGRQLVEAADSVGSNIAEGYGRFHYKDNRQFQFYARGSLNETVYWLRRANKRNLISEEQCESLITRTQELIPQLNAYIRTLGRRSQLERDKRHES